MALVEQGVAAPYVPAEAATVPARYRSTAGLWTGFAGRIRVMLYNTDMVKPGEAPRSILDLTEPRWKGRFAFANPHFGTMSFHAASLFVKWGDARAIDFLQRLKDNDAVIAAGNSDVKDRVADGRVAVGILDEDDAVVAIREKKPVAIAIPDQEGSDRCHRSRAGPAKGRWIAPAGAGRVAPDAESVSAVGQRALVEHWGHGPCRARRGCRGDRACRRRAAGVEAKTA